MAAIALLLMVRFEIVGAGAPCPMMDAAAMHMDMRVDAGAAQHGPRGSHVPRHDARCDMPCAAASCGGVHCAPVAFARDQAPYDVSPPHGPRHILRMDAPRSVSARPEPPPPRA